MHAQPVMVNAAYSKSDFSRMIFSSIHVCVTGLTSRQGWKLNFDRIFIRIKFADK